MAAQFLTKSRHGSVYYFRRRVPQAAQSAVGKRVLVQSLETSDRRVAVVRSRALAVQTDAIFQRVTMAIKPNTPGCLATSYAMKLDFDAHGRLSSLHVEAKPEERGAVNSAIKTALEAVSVRGM